MSDLTGQDQGQLEECKVCWGWHNPWKECKYRLHDHLHDRYNKTLAFLSLYQYYLVWPSISHPPLTHIHLRVTQLIQKIRGTLRCGSSQTLFRHVWPRLSAVVISITDVCLIITFPVMSLQGLQTWLLRLFFPVPCLGLILTACNGEDLMHTRTNRHSYYTYISTLILCGSVRHVQTLLCLQSKINYVNIMKASLVKRKHWLTLVNHGYWSNHSISHP